MIDAGQTDSVPVSAVDEAAVPAAVRKTSRLAGVFALTLENALIAGLFAAAVVTRLWGLGWRVMSHDESLHVFYSWLLAAGKGYSHNPMMHGPLLFEATALIDKLLGATDFTSRLFPALLGIFLVVGIPQLFKPWLGRWGALAASLFLLISPFVLFYARYIRHDPIVIVWLLLLVRFLLGYLDTGRERHLIGVAISLALMFTTMEITFIYLAILAVYLITRLVLTSGLNWGALRQAREFDLLVVLATLGAFFSAPIGLLVLNPIWTRLTGAPFVDVNLLAVQGTEWAVGATRVRMIGLLAVFWMAATYIGMWWDWQRWWKLAVIFGGIAVTAFTTFFTNPSGLATGFIGSLGYWLSQQTVARGGQPWYYFAVVLPLYEYLPLLGGIAGAIFFLVRRKFLSSSEQAFLVLVIWWGMGITGALSLAGEKMPWHTVQVVVPFILLAAWLAGQLARRPAGEEPGRVVDPGWARKLALGGFGLLALLTARTSYFTNYVNYDYPTEFVDYAHGAPGVKWAVDALAAAGRVTGDGLNLRVAYDNDVSWPMSWYLRDYPSSVFFGAQPSREVLDAPVVLAGPDNWNKVDALIGQNYT
ncbi:MAG TPA: flippase activity-associated protein Agl23, partial [Anaerolineaceae bacterium]